MSSTIIPRKPTRIIKASEIKQFYSMPKAIDAMEKAFYSMSSGESFVPPRFVTMLPSEQLIMLFKPAYVEKDQRVAVKILSQRVKSCMQGIPVIQGIILVVDSVTGEILSIMDGEYITALRTGAASGLATRYLATKNAHTLALFGCGAQGATQMEAILCEAAIQRVFVFDKNKNLAERFIEEMERKHQIEMVFCKDTSVLEEADIICTATNSTKPLFSREEVKKGVHINSIGSFQPHMQELDPLLIRDAKVYVDQAEPCLRESGDLIKPLLEGIVTSPFIMGEIGELIGGQIPGRESKDEITLFKSVGVAIQDYAVATDIYNLSLSENFGKEISFFE